MQKIIQFFDMIKEFVYLVTSFIWNILQTLLNIFATIKNIFVALPTSIIIVLSAVIAFSIAYKIISLGGSGEWAISFLYLVIFLVLWTPGILLVIYHYFILCLLVFLLVCLRNFLKEVKINEKVFNILFNSNFVM